jgi:ABC-type tungstate transport system substrate-binding protein
MDINELKGIAVELKEFVASELLKLKSVTGANAVSFKAITAVVADVVKKLDEIKKKFTSLTDIQLHDLAVDAVLELLLFLLASRLGGVGKWLFTFAPLSVKRQFAGIIVDVIVSLLHRKPQEQVA